MHLSSSWNALVIRLEKGPKPQLLVDNGTAWNAEYAALRAAGLKDNVVEGRHRHPDIKAAVIAEAFDKCIYCEEKLSSSQFGTWSTFFQRLPIHICMLLGKILPLPATGVITRIQRGRVCEPVCRRAFGFYSVRWTFLSYPPGNAKGRLTVKGLKLNRIALLERRAEALKEFVEKLDLFQSSPQGPIRYVLEWKIQEAIANDREYAGTLRQY